MKAIFQENEDGKKKMVGSASGDYRTEDKSKIIVETTEEKLLEVLNNNLESSVNDFNSYLGYIMLENENVVFDSDYVPKDSSGGS